MRGPDHYREAERLLGVAEQRVSENWPAESGEHKADILAAAQVHATLALAAATAAEQATRYDGDELGARSRGWGGVA